jgi:hypothetical protein
MLLNASWKVFFALIIAVNKAGDQNVTGFANAMDLKASLGKKMTKLVQPVGLLLMANATKEIAILCHPHNFGGTLLCPSNKVSCLIRVGPSAVLVVLDHNGAFRPIVAPQSTILPPSPSPMMRMMALLLPLVAKSMRTMMVVPTTEPKTKISPNVDNVATLPLLRATPPPLHSVAMSPPAAEAADVVMVQPADMAMHPTTITTASPTARATPPLEMAAKICKHSRALSLPPSFKTQSWSSSLEHVFAAKLVRDAHVQAHKGKESFNAGAINAHVEFFSLWCLRVHHGKVKETQFSLASNDSELMEWSASLHHEDIIPSIATAENLPTSLEDAAVIL